ncbi:MAG: transglycosylase SLT domain-containing protein, partial [Myxococcales bacterium]|nr:transglycosylase SLT domain-containing protein [Myxococcales bacterium]
LGPMQVLPRTGRRIAARLGVPAGDFFAARLYEPGLALRHAAWYLAALREEFGGNLLLAVAAYNGGPLRFAEHVLVSRALPFDLLIEEIGAHESRNYVRKVADHLVRFATIYGDDLEREALLTALRPPETVPLPRGELRF